MENLIFSLNATVPVFLMMVLGLFLHKIGLIDDGFASKMNQFVFRVPLPLLLFGDLAKVDFDKVWNPKFVLFCFVVTVFSIGISSAISFFWKDKSIQGEFIQASYRSSAAILGIAFIQNIYGTSGMAPLMIIGSVPLYNIMAVLVLSLSKPGQEGINQAVFKKTLKGIVTNPIILGISAGLLWSALGLLIPPILDKMVTSVAGMTTPMGLIAMGAAFDLRKAFAKMKPAITAALIKLLGFCAIFLPAAVRLGFRREELVAILVMLGSATTVSCYVMAKNMGHEGVLSSSVVMLTTLLSAFTLTGWLYVLRNWGLI
ncbi:MAG: AEC family transporter [Dorea sp.]|jgi:predicted permease|nr:AEC family transporter [Dorea sp.]